MKVYIDYLDYMNCFVAYRNVNGAFCVLAYFNSGDYNVVVGDLLNYGYAIVKGVGEND